MLVLGRRPGEWIEVGQDITIHVIRIDGNQVRIGIDAPRDIQILRGEILDQSESSSSSESTK